MAYSARLAINFRASLLGKCRRGPTFRPKILALIVILPFCPFSRPWLRSSRDPISGALLLLLMSFTHHEIQTTVANIEAKFRSPPRRQSVDGFSDLARMVMLSNTSTSSTNVSTSANHSPPPELILPPDIATASTPSQEKKSLKPSPHITGWAHDEDKSRLQPNGTAQSHGRALTDTPTPSAPGSPHM